MGYGWRIPFLLGLVTGIAAIFLRRIVQESEKFKELKSEGRITRSPLSESLRIHWRPIITILSATVMFAVSFYLIFVYIITFGTRYGGMELSAILKLNTTVLALTTVLIPLGGYLSDRIGRKPSLIIGCAGEILVGIVLFNVFSGDNLTLKIIVQIAGGLFMVVFAGAFAPFMAESFPTNVRMSGISMGNVIGFSVFGGSAPLVASYLISSTGNINAPGIYLSVCAVISLLAVTRIKETYKQELG
jgi:MFS transporter, MHS family, proline/betaine transporter